MSGKLVLAVPSKGRLQENANAFFARAGLAVQQARGARDYRGVLAGVESPSRYLPSRVVQAARRAALPSDDALRTAFAEALVGKNPLVFFVEQIGGVHAAVLGGQ